MRALGFGWDDLEANRAGALSKRQRRRLMSVRAGQTLMIVGILLVMPLFLAPWLQRVAGVLAGVLSPVTGSFLLMSGIALLPLVGIWWAARRLNALNADLEGGTVEALSGQITRLRQPGGVGLITLGGGRWHVTRRVYDALCDNTRYRLYVSPRARVLLSAEPLDN